MAYKIYYTAKPKKAYREEAIKKSITHTLPQTYETKAEADKVLGILREQQMDIKKQRPRSVKRFSKYYGTKKE
jgi:hypothetical protein